MLVGRNTELSVLNNHYRAMLTGHGSVLFITGEAGLGKTTLVHEWRKRAEDGGQRAEEFSSPQPVSVLNSPPSSLFLEAACSIPIGNVDVGALEALQPWADVIAQLQHFEQSQPATGGNKINLKKLIHDAAPSWAWALPFVGDIAHAALETSRLIREQRGEIESNAAAQNQQQVFQQYVNLLTRISQTQPLVILLDDMHWADASSCNLLFYLSRQITDQKILVIATYRPDDVRAANNGKGHAILSVKNEILRYSAGEELALGFLGAHEIRELMIGTFSDYVADVEFETWLRKLSDGNSLFVTQFLKTLAEDGHLDAHGKFSGDYNTIVIPQSTLAVVEERTRRLDDATRELLSYATAEGEEFTSYVLGKLTAKQPLQLLSELKKAQRLGIVSEHGSSRAFANQTTMIYGFSHALFHKALYDSLNDLEKEILHRQCFQLLKTEWDSVDSTPERTTTLATKLLSHAEKCGEWEIVARVALDTAKEFWKSYTETEAMEMLELAARALTHLPNEALRAELLMVRARIQQFRASFDAARDDFIEAKNIFQKLNQNIHVVDALNGLAGENYLAGHNEEGLAAADEALDLARRASYRRGEAIALNTRGNIVSRIGGWDTALELYQSSLVIQQELGDHVSVAKTLGNIGTAYTQCGDIEHAKEYLVKSLSLKEEIGDRFSVALGLGNLGLVFDLNEEYESALDYHRRSLAIREALGDRYGVAMAKNNMGKILAQLGRLDEGETLCRESLAMRVEFGDRIGQALVLRNLAMICEDRNELDAAREYVTQALAILDAHHDRTIVGECLESLSVIDRRAGLLERSRSLLEQAQKIFDTLHIPILTAEAMCEFGLLCEAEARATTGDARTKKINEAVQQLETGLQMLVKAKSKKAGRYREDVERIKKMLNDGR